MIAVAVRQRDAIAGEGLERIVERRVRVSAHDITIL
jgi:hypothetical protein